MKYKKYKLSMTSEGDPSKDGQQANYDYTVEAVLGRRHFSLEEMTAYLGPARDNVMWVPAKELLGDLHHSCVDGREDGYVVATPRGDISILTDAIIAIGSELNRKLDRVEIAKVFQWYLNTFGSFYMHTDEHGLENLMDSLRSDLRIKRSFADREEVLAYICPKSDENRPAPKEQIALLGHLMRPANIGCGHLKAMMENPQGYGVSRKVIEGLVEAFFDTLWNGDDKQRARLIYKVLGGDHREGAVTQIYVDGKDAEIDDETLIPMVRPKNGEVSTFVVHPQVVMWMQQAVAVALAESDMFPEVPVEEIRRIYHRMGELSESEVRLTVGLLALDLPKYIFVLRIQGK